MNVLSLFHGISAGQVALQRAGIPVENYYASEIDKYAIKITQTNYPNTIQLGDVTQNGDWDLPKIDLLIGGSPCQGFSFAGKQLNFDDPRSALFFEFVRCKQWFEPEYFLLENVKMKREYQDVISKYIGVEPIEINSSLVSAQNRKRLYWTNIPCITQPKDKNILLEGVLEHDAQEPMLSNIYGGFNEKQPRIHTSKSVTIRAASGGGHIPSVTLKGVIKNRDKLYERNEKAMRIDANYHKGADNHGQRTLITSANKDNYRKLTPLECERLQTFPEQYTNYVSNTQRYRALGNSWTIDVIAHIFNFMKLQELLK